RVGGTKNRKDTKETVIDSPVRPVDLVRTILDAVGADRDPTLPGASLVPVVDSGDRGDRPSYFEAMTYNLVRGWAPLRGVLQGRGKYIALPLPELYALAADPGEPGKLARSQSDRPQ